MSLMDSVIQPAMGEKNLQLTVEPELYDHVTQFIRENLIGTLGRKNTKFTQFPRSNAGLIIQAVFKLEGIFTARHDPSRFTPTE